MSAPSENMPITVSVPRSKPLLLRHLPYFIGAAVVVALAATMQFDGYIHNILMQATTFAIAVFGLSVVLGLCGQINLAQAAFFGFGYRQYSSSCRSPHPCSAGDYRIYGGQFMVLYGPCSNTRL